MLEANRVKQQLNEMAELVQEMANLVDEGAEDAPMAFFEACEDLQLQVTQLMRAAFMAVQQTPVQA